MITTLNDTDGNPQRIASAPFTTLLAWLETAKGAEKKAIQAELDRRAKMAAE